MSVKSDDFRRRAKNADESADKALDSEARAAFREIAEHWRTMAAQADRLGW